jgi:flagellar export protein FliJ
LNRHDRIKRIRRLLGHYRRVRDEKAGFLAGAEAALLVKKREIEALRQARDRTNAFITEKGNQQMDIGLLQIAAAYKKRLRSEMDIKQNHLREAKANVENKRRETTEAFRAHRIWEIVKDKLTTAENDNNINDNQREMDELAQQKRNQPSITPAGGIKRRTER